MKTKDILVGVGLTTVIYKAGKFVGKIECLEYLPDKKLTFKLSRHATVTISKPNKDKKHQ